MLVARLHFCPSPSSHIQLLPRMWCQAGVSSSFLKIPHEEVRVSEGHLAQLLVLRQWASLLSPSHLVHFYSLFLKRIQTLNFFYLLHHLKACKPMTPPPYFLNWVSFLFLAHRNVYLIKQSCVFFFSKLCILFSFTYYILQLWIWSKKIPWTLNFQQHWHSES